MAKTDDSIWEGPFDIFPARSESSADAFEQMRWLNIIEAQLLDYRDEVRKYGVALPPRSCTLPLVCSFSEPQTIIDFGGSSGWCWEYLNNILPANSVYKYTIIELESIVKHMMPMHKSSGNLRYTTNIEDIDECDLLYSNSVLQYFENNSRFLQVIKLCNPTYILLDDVVASSVEKDFFGLQNFYGQKIPYRFISLTNLIDEINEAGYEMMIKSPYLSPVKGTFKVFPMANFSEELRIRCTQTILFRKTGLDASCQPPL